MSGTLSSRPMKVVHGFSASGCTVTNLQNCLSVMTISVTPWSRTQLLNDESRTCSRSVNIVSGMDFFISVFLGWQGQGQGQGQRRGASPQASHLYSMLPDRL